jgi:hypothetical protein
MACGALYALKWRLLDIQIYQNRLLDIQIYQNLKQFPPLAPARTR